MAADQGHPTATEMDYPAHNRNYAGFTKLVKYGAIAAFIITAIVVLVIAN